MRGAPWQDEVARLLDQAAQSLRDGADRRAVRSFGTAIAYLELARETGDRLATELLATAESAKEDATERFTFQPGELEALTKSDPASKRRPSKRPSSSPSSRPSRKKKK